MRFKATFSDRGTRVLEKGFLPTLEKLGKNVSVLLTPDEVFLIQTTADADGARIIAKADKDVLFAPSTYRVASKHHNLIAFECEVPLLTRVFKSATSNELDILEVKLVQRSMPSPDGRGTVSRPFLSFRGGGTDVQLVQDMPVSDPLRPAQVDALNECRDVDMQAYYVDLQPHCATLLGVLDRLKGMSGNVAIGVLPTGDLHVRVHEPGVEFGVELRGLLVLPADAAVDARSLGGATPAQRLAEGQQGGMVSEVVMQSKLLAKALGATQITQPFQVLLGVPHEGGCVHVTLVYKNPQASEYDDSMYMSLHLPVCGEEGG